MPRRSANKHPRSSRTSHVKENAGIRPFFEPRETRRQYGNRSKYLPKSDDSHEICWISKTNKTFDISRQSRELGTAIERAIAKLRPEYRACIMLRHVEDKSYEEIAEIVKLPLGTVKTYIHRARHELRVALGDVR